MPVVPELFPALVALALGATLLAACGAVLAALLRRASAASRHLVWTAVLAAAALLPLVRWTLPVVRVGVLPASFAVPTSVVETASPLPAPPRPEASSDIVRQIGTASGGSGTGGAPRLASTVDTTVLGGTPMSSSHLGLRETAISAIVALWLAGVVVFALRNLAGSVGLAGLARRAAPETHAALQADAARIAAALGVRRAVRLLRSHDECVPVTWGVLHPTILLPASAGHWDADRRALVLTHELGHVARFDVLVHTVAQWAVALHWFNPFVRLAARRACAERERACDDLVIASGARPSSYASELLGFMRSLHPPRASSLAALAMARPTEFEGRLLAILDPRLRRGGISRLSAGVSIGAFALAVPAATLAPSLREQPVAELTAAHDTTRPAVTRATSATPGTNVIAPVLNATSSTERPTTPARPVQAGFATAWTSGNGGECSSRGVRSGHWSSTSQNRSGDTYTMVRSDDTTCIVVTAIGKVAFTDTDDDVATVAAGGYIDIVQRLRGVEHEYRVSASGDGTLTRVYRRDGTEHPLADARAWLAALVPMLERESGIGAEARVARLRQQGGVTAVLDDARLITSDGAKRRYMEILMAGGGLSTADLSGVTRLAATIGSDGDRRAVLERTLDAGKGPLAPDVVAAAHGISSDGDKAAVLLRVLDVMQPGDELPDRFFSDAQDISSDGDKARVLAQVARVRSGSATDQMAALHVARSINSDGDKARVLAEVVHDAGASVPILTEVVSVAKTIDSDGDKARVLLAVVHSDSTTTSVLRATIATAHGIDSDGDKANVLRTIARSPGAADPDVRGDIIAVAKSISSDGDYRSVMNALGLR